MRNLNMIVWFTQLGLSVALPPLGLIWLAVWLRNEWNWGSWVIWVGVILGVVCAIDGLRLSLKAMHDMSKDRKEQDAPVSFNEHD